MLYAPDGPELDKTGRNLVKKPGSFLQAQRTQQTTYIGKTKILVMRENIMYMDTTGGARIDCCGWKRSTMLSGDSAFVRQLLERSLI